MIEQKEILLLLTLVVKLLLLTRVVLDQDLFLFSFNNVLKLCPYYYVGCFNTSLIDLRYTA